MNRTWVRAGGAIVVAGGLSVWASLPLAVGIIAVGAGLAIIGLSIESRE